MKKLIHLLFLLLPLFGVGQSSMSESGSILTLMWDSIAGYAGDTVSVSLRGIGFTNMYEFSGTLLYDSATVEFIEYSQDSLDGTLYVFDNDSGQIRFSWHNGGFSPLTLPDSVSLFSIAFKLIGLPGSTSPLQFSHSPTPIRYLNEYNPFSGSNYIMPDTVPGSIHIIDNLVSIADKQREDILLYPNPTTSTIRIQLPENNLNAISTSLYDMTGRLVHQQTFNPNMDLGYLNRGTYVVVVETEEGNFRETIQKE